MMSDITIDLSSSTITSQCCGHEYPRVKVKIPSDGKSIIDECPGCGVIGTLDLACQGIKK